MQPMAGPISRWLCRAACRWSAWAALAVLALALPARAQFKCPDDGGPAWREVRTLHFVVQTDLDSAEARKVASDLERLFDLVRFGLIKSRPEAPGTIRVIALRSLEEFKLFAPAGASAFYRRHLMYGPTIVLPGTLGDQERAILAHELAHDVMLRVYPRPPWWFSEGMSSYMETVAPEDARDGAAVGGVPRRLLRLVSPYRGGIENVLTQKPVNVGATGYALAWALVHYLSNERPAQFAELQARFARGQDPWLAWAELFPNWDPAKTGGAETLDGELERYFQRGRFRYRPVQLPPEAPLTERPLTAANAHTVRLLLLPWSNQGQAVQPEMIEAEIAEAVRHDPGHVMALMVRAQRHPALREGCTEKAMAAHPEDPMAWWLKGMITTDQATMEVMKKITALDPQNAFALNVLAAYLLTADRTVEALTAAEAAVRYAPWDDGNWFTLSRTLEKLGRCQEALEAQRRAVELDGEVRATKSQAEQRLDKLKVLCAGGSDAKTGTDPAAAKSERPPAPPP
jgi:tetratricopeptide (TPR) repeat protein